MQLKHLLPYLQIITGIKTDEAMGFNLLAKCAKRLTPSYRLTWPELSWLQNPKLAETLSLFDENDGFNAHRKFALQQLLRLVEGIHGDTVECGAYKGCSSYIMLQANQRSNLDKTHHIFDSFEGLSPPTEKDGSYWHESDLSIGESIVKNNLRDFDQVKLYKGWIPGRFKEVEGCRFSFIHVDVDLYQPTLDSIIFFYEKLNPGGIFVCDDYGFTTCPGATKAINEFLTDKPEKMVSLSGGGGFFVKGCATAPE